MAHASAYMYRGQMVLAKHETHESSWALGLTFGVTPAMIFFHRGQKCPKNTWERPNVSLWRAGGGGGVQDNIYDVTMSL